METTLVPLGRMPHSSFQSVSSSSSTVLEVLWIYDTKLSTRGAIDLFIALQDNNKLKVLDIAITNDACGAITTASGVGSTGATGAGAPLQKKCIT